MEAQNTMNTENSLKKEEQNWRKPIMLLKETEKSILKFMLWQEKLNFQNNLKRDLQGWRAHTFWCQNLLQKNTQRRVLLE